MIPDMLLVIVTIFLINIKADSGCIPRVEVWDENTEQDALLNCLDGTGKQDKSLTAIMCSKQEQYQHSLDMSLANRLYRNCDSRCVYNLHVNDADDVEAFLWNDAYQCWRPKSDGLCFTKYEDDHEHMKMYVQQILCPAVPTLVPSSTPTERPTVCIARVQVWNQDTASAALETCVDGTGKTDKSLSAAMCTKQEQYQDNLELSLANRLWPACDSRCVYNINATQIAAFLWNNEYQCWRPKSDGLCIRSSEFAMMTEYIDNTLCPADCEPYYEWSAIREGELCPGGSESDTISYDAVLCANSDSEQEKLEESLANQLFHDCSSICVYDYNTLRNNILNESNDYGGYIWRASKSCWKWVTEGRCFNNLVADFDEAMSRVEKVCSDQGSYGGEAHSGITMALKTSGGNEKEFIVSKLDILSGEISNSSSSIEQTGWRFYYPVGKTLFSSGYSVDNRCAGYTSDVNGNIVKKGEFVFGNALEMFGSADDGEKFLAMEIARVGYADRRLYFIDVNTVSVLNISALSIFKSETDGQVSWPTALKVRDGKLFIPFHKLDAQGYFTTPDPDKAYVAVYDYPNTSRDPIKIIEDDRTSNIGVNGATTGLIEAENGDLYSFSCGAMMAGFSPASTKPSGILKISSGQTEFNSSYFFNIEAATNGGKLFWFDYVGDNKAIARILTEDNGILWDAYGRTTFNQKLVIIDLVDQTVTDIANVPLHAKRYSSPVYVHEGKVYVSVETSSDAYVYEVKIASAAAIRGAKIQGKTIKGFFNLG